jgi:general secretion pathway protein H
MAGRPRRSLTMSGGRRSKAGIVLLDVVVALAVIALAALILVPRPAPGLSKSDLRIAATDAAAVIRAARVAAIRDSAPRDVRIAGGRVALEPNGRVAVLPDGLAARWVASSQCPVAGGARLLRFLPDGRSCGGVLTLETGGSSAVIRVDWLTGRVETALP